MNKCMGIWSDHYYILRMATVPAHSQIATVGIQNWPCEIELASYILCMCLSLMMQLASQLASQHEYSQVHGVQKRCASIHKSILTLRTEIISQIGAKFTLSNIANYVLLPIAPVSEKRLTSQLASQLPPIKLLCCYKRQLQHLCMGKQIHVPWVVPGAKYVLFSDSYAPLEPYTHFWWLDLSLICTQK